MADTYEPNIDNIGGGGFGGFGGGNNSLLWFLLILFGLDGKRGFGGDAGAGVLAGETQAKLDCLAQGHNTLSQQIAQNQQSLQFQTLAQEINAVSTTARDSRDAITGQIADLRQQLGDCCCDLRAGQQSIKTDIAMQTAILTAEGKNNTQAILDKLCDNQAALKDAEIRRLQDALQTQTILSNCNGGGNHGGGNNIDINVLARALQGQSQVN